MDNYSCELYKRAIRIHKKQKHNSKGLEKTFVARESIRNFLEYFKLKNGAISSYENKPRCDFKFAIVDEPTPFYLKENSFESASQLLSDLQGNDNIKLQRASKSDVAIG